MANLQPTIARQAPDARTQKSDLLCGQEDTDRAGKDSHQGSGDDSPEDDRCVRYELGDHLDHLSFAGVPHYSIAPTSIEIAWLNQDRSHEVTYWGWVNIAPEVSPSIVS